MAIQVAKADQGDSRLAENARLFVHDALDSPIISLILHQTLVDNLDAAAGEDAVTTFLQERGYDTSLEAVASAVEQMRNSELSAWRGYYELYLDGQPGPRLLIAANGEVSLNGVVIEKPTYAALVLSWSASDGNASSARLQFDLVYGRAKAYSGNVCTGEYTVSPDQGGGARTSKVLGKLNTFNPGGAALEATDPLEFWNGTYIVTIDRKGQIDRHRLTVNAAGAQGTVQVDGQTISGWHFTANLLRWDATSGNAVGAAVLFTEHPLTGLRLCVGRFWRQPDPEAVTANATGRRLPDELVARSLQSTGTLADWQTSYHVTISVGGPTPPPQFYYAVLEVRSDGTIVFDRNAPVTPTFDSRAPSLSWSVSPGNVTAGNIIFMMSDAVPNLRVFRGSVWGTIAGVDIAQASAGPNNAQGTELLNAQPPIVTPGSGPDSWLIFGIIGMVFGALGLTVLAATVAARLYYARQRNGDDQGAAQELQQVRRAGNAVAVTKESATAAQSPKTSRIVAEMTERERRVHISALERDPADADPQELVAELGRQRRAVARDIKDYEKRIDNPGDDDDVEDLKRRVAVLNDRFDQIWDREQRAHAKGEYNTPEKEEQSKRIAAFSIR